MFYGSEFISATAFESRWNMEDDSLIGCWKINKKSPNAKFAMCLSRFREEIKVDLDSKLSKALLLQLKFLDEIFSIDRDKNFLVEEHDGKEIKKETPKDKIHKISASIAQHIIERENVDGIIYLSAQGQGAKALFPPYDESDYLFNVALLPSYVKEHMNLKVVYKVSISTHFDGTNRKRAERKATHIGIPLNNNKLAFSKITKKQNNHFNSIHNNSGVPVINTKYTLGIPEIYITNKPLFNDIINNNPCSQHKLTADLWNEETEGIKYQVVQPCCDESSEHLKEILRSHDIWKD